MDKKKLIVFLPAYNESAHISSVITESRRFTDSVVVIDDGSTDDTIVVAQSSSAVVLLNNKNCGYGFTIQRILQEARSNNIVTLVILDADGQHSPADIPRLVEAVEDGYDLVIGCRAGRDVPGYRRIGGTILSVFTFALSGRWVRDSQCGFRAYSYRAVDLIRPKENGMAVSSEIVALAAWASLKIMEVPISVKYLEDSSTHNPVKQGFYTLWRLVVMIARKRLLGE